MHYPEGEHARNQSSILFKHGNENLLAKFLSESLGEKLYSFLYRELVPFVEWGSCVASVTLRIDVNGLEVILDGVCQLK